MMDQNPLLGANPRTSTHWSNSSFKISAKVVSTAFPGSLQRGSSHKWSLRNNRTSKDKSSSFQLKGGEGGAPQELKVTHSQTIHSCSSRSQNYTYHWFNTFSIKIPITSFAKPMTFRKTHPKSHMKSQGTPSSQNIFKKNKTGGLIHPGF